ncbi:MAG: CYTH domain-containing protein [Lachnospiraceae bacterium]|nr:CYTH domain-containing protein [Lachnospiraceae bacterium]
MEIERKFLISRPPMALESYSFHRIEQGYLCTHPVVRVRRQDDCYYLTYKGGGMMVREEYNLPLTEEAYLHLLPKSDGNVITKTRYLIPLENSLTCELDVFEGVFEGLILAEVEFPDEQAAGSFVPPDWFIREVTNDPRYHNSYMSSLNLEQDGNGSVSKLYGLP